MVEDELEPVTEVNALNAGQKVLRPAALVCRRLLLRCSATTLDMRDFRQPEVIVEYAFIIIIWVLCCVEANLGSSAGVPAQHDWRSKRA